MSRSDITARNRANARKSTGPRTARGKAAVADNARRHGATARPDPARVRAWLAIILDRPEITADDLLPEGEAGFRALALAEAEARLVSTQEALDRLEAGKPEPSDPARDYAEVLDMLKRDVVEGGSAGDINTGLSLLRQISGAVENPDASGGHRHVLLQRYLREARTGRRRAFEAWAASRPDIPGGA
jgi:hypothetical protein